MKIIGIYPGRFQPAHKGHFGVYQRLRQIAGPDTYIVTSDKAPTPDSPLNFSEKQQIWVRHGVPSSHIVKVKNTYSPIEVTNNYMVESTSAIFALGGKDVERFGSRKAKDPKTGKEIWMKSDGKTPGYFQPYKGNEDSMESLDKHGYVMIIPDIRIDGKKVSGTKIREGLSSPKYTPEQKKKFFFWAFGWFDPSLYEMMEGRFSDAARTPEPTAQPQQKKTPTTITKQAIQEMVMEILQEFSEPQGIDPSLSTNDPLADDRQDKEQQSKKDAIQSKQQAERELDSLNKDLKWKQSDVLRKRKDDIPNKRKEIDSLNKTIASGGTIEPPTSTSSY